MTKLKVAGVVALLVTALACSGKRGAVTCEDGSIAYGKEAKAECVKDHGGVKK